MWTEKFYFVWVALNINIKYSSLYINVTSFLSFVKGGKKRLLNQFLYHNLIGTVKKMQSWIVNGSVNCMKQLLRLTMCLSACLHGDWEGGFAETADALILCLLFWTVWWDNCGTHGGVWTMSVGQDICVWETWSAFAFLLCCLVLPLKPKTPGSSWLLGFLMWFAVEEGIWQTS